MSWSAVEGKGETKQLGNGCPPVGRLEEVPSSPVLPAESLSEIPRSYRIPRRTGMKSGVEKMPSGDQTRGSIVSRGGSGQTPSATPTKDERRKSSRGNPATPRHSLDPPVPRAGSQRTSQQGNTSTMSLARSSRTPRQLNQDEPSTSGTSKAQRRQEEAPSMTFSSMPASFGQKRRADNSFGGTNHKRRNKAHPEGEVRSSPQDLLDGIFGEMKQKEDAAEKRRKETESLSPFGKSGQRISPSDEEKNMVGKLTKEMLDRHLANTDDRKCYEFLSRDNLMERLLGHKMLTGRLESHLNMGYIKIADPSREKYRPMELSPTENPPPPAPIRTVSPAAVPSTSYGLHQSMGGGQFMPSTSGQQQFPQGGALGNRRGPRTPPMSPGAEERERAAIMKEERDRAIKALANERASQGHGRGLRRGPRTPPGSPGRELYGRPESNAERELRDDISRAIGNFGDKKVMETIKNALKSVGGNGGFGGEGLVERGLLPREILQEVKREDVEGTFKTPLKEEVPELEDCSNMRSTGSLSVRMEIASDNEEEDERSPIQPLPIFPFPHMPPPHCPGMPPAHQIPPPQMPQAPPFAPHQMPPPTLPMSSNASFAPPLHMPPQQMPPFHLPPPMGLPPQMLPPSQMPPLSAMPSAPGMGHRSTSPQMPFSPPPPPTEDTKYTHVLAAPPPPPVLNPPPPPPPLPQVVQPPPTIQSESAYIFAPPQLPHQSTSFTSTSTQVQRGGPLTAPPPALTILPTVNLTTFTAAGAAAPSAMSAAALPPPPVNFNAPPPLFTAPPPILASAAPPPNNFSVPPPPLSSTGVSSYIQGPPPPQAPGQGQQPPNMTTMPPSMSTMSPCMSTLPPDMSKMPPSMSAMHTSLSNMPPSMSAMPPSMSAMPPSMSAMPPSMSAMPPSMSTMPPSMSTMPPSMSTMPPSMSNMPPSMSAMPPSMSVMPSSVSTMPPGLSNIPPVMSTMPPIMSTLPPSMSMRPPVLSTMPPDMSKMPPSMSKMPPGMSAMPPNMSTVPPNMSTMPPGISTRPPMMATRPPGLTTMPPPSIDTSVPPPNMLRGCASSTPSNAFNSAMPAAVSNSSRPSSVAPAGTPNRCMTPAVAGAEGVELNGSKETSEEPKAITRANGTHEQRAPVEEMNTSSAPPRKATPMSAAPAPSTALPKPCPTPSPSPVSHAAPPRKEQPPVTTITQQNQSTVNVTKTLFAALFGSGGASSGNSPFPAAPPTSMTSHSAPPNSMTLRSTPTSNTAPNPGGMLVSAGSSGGMPILYDRYGCPLPVPADKSGGVGAGKSTAPPHSGGIGAPAVPNRDGRSVAESPAGYGFTQKGPGRGGFLRR